jgi:hypothetical protein
VTSKAIDARADIYALGIVFYEMVTGRGPYLADTPMAVMIKKTTEPLPRPSRFVADLPEAVERVIVKALAKEPVNRYQEMGEFARALERLAAEGAYEMARMQLVQTRPDVDAGETIPQQTDTSITRDQKHGSVIPTLTLSPKTPQAGKSFRWLLPVGIGALLLLVGCVVLGIAWSLNGRMVGNRQDAAFPTSVPSNPTYSTSVPSSPTSLPTVLPTTSTRDIPLCPGTLPSRLRVGIDAQVAETGKAWQLSLRSAPSQNAEQAHVVAAGRKLVVLDGPVCAEGSYWWYVRSEQGFEGWAREGDSADYWITPLTGLTPVSPASIPTSKPIPGIYGFYTCQAPCQPDGSNSITAFPEKTTIIYVSWNFENFPANAHYIRAWNSNGDEWIRYDCTWPGPSTGNDAVTLTEPGGLRSGTWEIAIDVNGQVVLKRQIFIEGSWDYWSPAGIVDACYGKR